MQSFDDIITELPPGVFTISALDHRQLANFISDVSTASLFKHDDCQMRDAQATAFSWFVWGADASQYFLLDNIFDELALGFRYQGNSDNEIEQHVAQLLTDVGLSNFVYNAPWILPSDLSGGQQQRLLLAVIISRRIPRILAVDAMVYVSRRDRDLLLGELAKRIATWSGRLLVCRTDYAIPDYLPTGDLFLNADGHFVLDPPTMRSKLVQKASAVPPISSRKGAESNLLYIRNMSFKYPDGRTGIDIDELTIAAGHVYGIVGPNGGGKSSLVRAICSTNRVAKTSTYMFKGKNIERPFRELLLAGRIGVVFQDPNTQISTETVQEFLARKKVPPNIYERLLLSDYADKDLGTSPLWIKQACVFAAQMAIDADLLVLDEPVDGLSFHIFGKQISEMIKQRSERGKTTVIVTHNRDFAIGCADRFILVKDQHVHVTPLEDRSPAQESPLDNWLLEPE